MAFIPAVLAGSAEMRELISLKISAGVDGIVGTPCNGSVRSPRRSGPDPVYRLGNGGRRRSDRRSDPESCLRRTDHELVPTRILRSAPETWRPWAARTS